MKTTHILFLLLINFLASGLSSHCLAAELEFATPNLHGIVPPATPLEETIEEPLAGTSFEEYMNLDSDAQRDLVIATKNNLAAKIRNKQSERALCVANLFNDTAEGSRQLDNLENALERAANQNMDKSAEEVTELLIAVHYCPPSLKLRQNTLEAYMKLDDRAQNILIINTQGHIITQIRDSEPERASCIATLFTDDDEGTQRLNVVKATLADAANKKLSNSAEVVTELVITKYFCPPTSTEGDD